MGLVSPRAATYGSGVASYGALGRAPTPRLPTISFVHGGQKWHRFLYALTLSNINRFSKSFHCHNQEKTCNNTITKDPTTPQVCRYTTL